MEGQFGRRYKGPGHPHINLSKAALNMLTRTSAGEMLASDRILMTAVDTGWITDERPTSRQPSTCCSHGRHSLRGWVRGYGPPRYRLGNQMRYRPNEVRAWVDQHVLPETD
jgi:NAD(P)-dependent dehydrogenase (short-subunit alcohol dehydrogenase family)